jgi:hypothetical protein
MSKLLGSSWNAVELRDHVTQQQERRLNICQSRGVVTDIRRIFRGKILYRRYCNSLVTRERFVSICL